MSARDGFGLVTLGLLACMSVPGAHAQGPGQGSASPDSSVDQYNPAPAAEPSPADPAQAADLPVLAVNGIEVVRTAAEPKIDIVYVTGIVAANGWGAPQLVPTYAGKPSDDVLDLELVATPPDQSEPASGYVTVSAVLALDPGHTFKGVRVRGSENALTVGSLPGNAQAGSRLFDCKDCVGKHFLAAGQGTKGGPDTVSEEDLPKALRLVRPADGIKGADQNPNRLTLILDENDTILQAFWE